MINFLFFFKKKKVQTGKKNKADIKMSTNAKGKNVKTSSSMEAKSGKNKGSTKGKASTQVKGKKKKREDSGEVRSYN